MHKWTNNEQIFGWSQSLLNQFYLGAHRHPAIVHRIRKPESSENLAHLAHSQTDRLHTTACPRQGLENDACRIHCVGTWQAEQQRVVYIIMQV